MYDNEPFVTNNLIMHLILRDNRAIKSFIRNFKGDESDEEDFSDLMFEIDCNRLGIPALIQDKIDLFIEEYLDPMVYEPETVFEKVTSSGNVEDGMRYIDRKEGLSTAEYMDMLIAVGEQWDAFSMENLHPYLML